MAHQHHHHQQQQQGARVLAALAASMEATDPSARAAAEAALAAEARLPGFAPVLAHAATARDAVAPELRQMSAVMLKQVVRGRWASGGGGGGRGGRGHRGGDDDDGDDDGGGGGDDDDDPPHGGAGGGADSDDFVRANHGSTLPAGDSDDESVRMAPRRPGGAGAMAGARSGSGGGGGGAFSAAAGPPLPEADKAAVRAALPQGLSDPSSKVRTAVGVAVAAIAAHDWPHHWPELLPGLVGAVSNRRADPALAGGALRCLCLLAEDLDEEQKPELARLLSDDLRAIVEAGTAAAAAAANGGGAGPDAAAALPLRRPALAAWRHLLTGLGTLAGGGSQQHARAVRDLLAPSLPAWTAAIAAVLGRGADGGGGSGYGGGHSGGGGGGGGNAPSSSSPLSDRQEWGVRKEALRVAQALVVYFAKPLAPHLPVLMGGVWRLFADAAALHQRVLVEGGGGEDEEEEGAAGGVFVGGGVCGGAADVDEEGGVMDLEGLLAQVSASPLFFPLSLSPRMTTMARRKQTPRRLTAAPSPPFSSVKRAEGIIFRGLFSGDYFPGIIFRGGARAPGQQEIRVETRFPGPLFCCPPRAPQGLSLSRTKGRPAPRMGETLPNQSSLL